MSNIKDFAIGYLTSLINGYERLEAVYTPVNIVVADLKGLLTAVEDMNTDIKPDLSEVVDDLGEGEIEEITEHMTKAFEVAAEMKRRVMEARGLPGKCPFKDKCIQLYKEAK